MSRIALLVVVCAFGFLPLLPPYALPQEIALQPGPQWYPNAGCEGSKGIDSPWSNLESKGAAGKLGVLNPGDGLADLKQIGPSYLCQSTSNVGLIRVANAIKKADAAYKAGNVQAGSAAATQARTDLRNILPSIKSAASSADATSSSPSASTSSPMMLPKSITDLFTAGRQAAELGMTAESTSLMEQFAAAHHDWGQKEATRLAGEGREDTVRGEVDQDKLRNLAEIWRIAAVLDDQPLSDFIKSTFRELHSSAFEFAAATLPCPPSEQDVTNLLHLSRMESLFSENEADIGVASRHFDVFRQAAERWLRDAAQSPTTSERGRLGKTAAILNLDTLANEFLDGKVKPPRCTDGGDWRGLIIYTRRSSERESRNGEVGLVDGKRTVESTMRRTYSAEIRLRASGTKASVKAEENMYSSDEDTGKVECVIEGTVQWKPFHRKSSTVVEQKASSSVDAQVGVSIDGKVYTIGVIIPEIDSGTSQVKKMTDINGGCGKPESTNNPLTGSWEAPSVSFDIEGKVSDPNSLSGQMKPDAHTTIRWGLTRKQNKPREVSKS